MGQQVVSLMYGISSKVDGLTTSEGDYFWDDFSDGVPRSKRYPDSEAPRVAYEGGVLGYSIASGPAYNDTKGEGFLGETVRLVDFATMHATRIDEAMKKWEAFAAWSLKEHGKTLPPPDLWLTTDERA